LFVVTLVRVVKFRRQVRHPWPTDFELQRQADDLAKRFGLPRSPEVKLVNALLPPMLWATQRSPVIFLPRALVERLTAEQTLTLLAHELAHYRRRDHWVRWLEVIVLGVYWWKPAAWIARQGLQRSEEECCDAWVLSVRMTPSIGWSGSKK
jgi:beta-lactamase regulating signal transducer with metallopeptidase domain